jgi:hypothetical protein
MRIGEKFIDEQKKKPVHGRIENNLKGLLSVAP